MNIYITHTCFLCEKIWHERRKRQQEFCQDCKDHPDYQIAYQLAAQLRRAKKAGAPATATLAVWKQTIAHFNNLCAYCQRRPFACLEHYIPLELGGGTTNDNILPACKYCNWKKENSHPRSIFLAKTWQRIEAYLQTQSTESEVVR